MSWIYQGKEFTDEMVPEGAYGFIYGMSVTIDGEDKVYIGKKNFYSERNIPLGKKALEARDDKRMSKKKKVKKLNYQNYHSSQATLKQAKLDGIPIKRLILKICNCKAELSYQETRYLFKTDALEKEEYLNDNILGKFYRSKIKCETNKSEEDE
jgi:hypothetical protein